MAWIEADAKSGLFKVVLRIGKQKLKKSLHTRDRSEAVALAQHPGGQNTFCLNGDVYRSKKQRTEPTAVTRDEVHDHFKRTLAGSKWDKLKGWHIFRHSFCSNCAAVGVDQRIINAWVGHQTEDMIRRYRHLIPNQQQAAIQQVFGATTAV